MSFESFDSAVGHFQTFLDDNKLPTSLLWLVRSRVRCNRTSLYVFRPEELIDTTFHRKRFDIALARNKNITFCLHAIHDGRSLIGLETMGLDPEHADFNESGSHNFQILESRLHLRIVNSKLKWQLIRMCVRNTHPMWSCLGWPP
jgi:hypothetical protein